MKKDLHPDATSLEDAFFAKENARLLERLRRQRETEDRRAALREVVGIRDEAVLDRLMELEIGPESALALRLVPLVFVAWADGRIDQGEKRAILQAAGSEGLAAADGARALLETWLSTRPEPRLLDLWKGYARALRDELPESERAEMRRSLVGAARAVAEAAGGFLGLTSKISPAEKAVLDDLEESLT